MKIAKHSHDIWSIDEVLPTDICNDCIEVAESDKLFPIKLSGLPYDIHKSFSNRIFLTSPELAELIWKKISLSVPQEYLTYPVSSLNNEFRFYKYLTTQEFKMHQDIDFEKSNGERSFFSLLVYLNDDFNGGETTFENLTIKPKAGSILIFPHKLFHSGSRVTKGIKYVLRSDILYRTV